MLALPIKPQQWFLGAQQLLQQSLPLDSTTRHDFLLPRLRRHKAYHSLKGN